METFFIEEKLNSLLAVKFQEEGFEDCFLVEFGLPSPTRLEVFVDSDSGVDFDVCRKISRYLEAVIEEENWFGEKYTIDVSSPGLSRPLKFKRQYLKNIGRNLKIHIADGSLKTGKLIKVEENTITIEDTVTVKEGKKNKKVVVQTELPFDEINRTFVEISFK